MVASNSEQRRIAIVGSGFSGLCLGIHLKKIGNDNFVIYEKESGLGGTWRDNTYPGAECDVASALYSFSFERNPNWTYKWSDQAEILKYMEHCASKYDLNRHIQYDKEVIRATFDDEDGSWTVDTADGSSEKFDAFVSGVGQLHKPATPSIEGADSFSGDSFHSAQWNHEVDLKGKNVAVIGNAASAIQFIPEIAPEVNKLHVFQRSANWMMPKNDREYTAFEKWLGTVFPPFTNVYRLYLWLRGEGLLYPLMDAAKDSRLRRKSEEAAKEYMEEKIADPELRKKLTPDYPMGAKRILFSDNYFDGVARDNVDIITDDIARINANGVVTADGTTYEADVIIYATGFETTSFLTPMIVQGRGGQVLNDIWEKEGAEAYLGITHAGYPNFFMMYGPNTNLGHNSIVVMIEAQTRYILSCLNALDAKQAKWLDVKDNVQKKYNEWLLDRMKDKVWNLIDDSWYKRGGKVTNNWVGRTTEYRKLTRAVNPEDYDFA